MWLPGPFMTCVNGEGIYTENRNKCQFEFAKVQSMKLNEIKGKFRNMNEEFLQSLQCNTLNYPFSKKHSRFSL